MPGAHGQENLQAQHHDQRIGVDSTLEENFYNQQSSGLFGNAATMDGSTFDFSFLSSIPNQGQVMGMDQIGFDNPDFSQRNGLPTSEQIGDQSLTSVSAIPPENFGSESNQHGDSVIVAMEDSNQDQNSPDEASLDDEYGLPGGKADGTDLGRNKDDVNAAPPAWSELKTKAGKDRKRLPLACIACRRKKIRCSGEKPACKHCLRSRIPCVYKVTTRKAAPRTDYMAMLDKRLKRMEDRVIKIIPKDDENQISSLTRATVKPSIANTASGSKQAAGSKKRGAEEAFGTDLESWAQTGLSGKEATDDGDAQPANVERQTEDSALFREGTETLPSKEVQQHLAEVFFDSVYGQAYPLLHKPSYMRKLKNNALPPVLVLSVCSVAARFSTEVGSSSTSGSSSSSARPFLRGEEWASKAREICVGRYEWPDTTMLTCLLILGLHEFGTCHGGRSWALGGQAIRMAFALQLHKDLEYDPASRGAKKPLSFIDREIRRRIMWACFLMDRFNSSGSDRPIFIKEETIQVQLPVKESLFQLDVPAETEMLDGGSAAARASSQPQPSALRDNMGTSAYMIRAVAAWGRIVSYLHQGGKEMDPLPIWDTKSRYSQLVQQAEELQQSLPEMMKYSKDNLLSCLTDKTASQYLLMHLALHQNVLFLHKAGVAYGNASPGQDRPADFLSRATAKTVGAANKISEILRDAEQYEVSVNAPFAGYCAFSATNIHIMGIFSGNGTVKTAAEVYAGINIKFLRRTMRYWGMFHWMVENIRMQYRKALEASRTGKTAPQLSANWPVLQYADWFNRYPHGVSDYDVEPSAANKKEKGSDAVLEQKPEMQSVGEFFTTLASPPPTEGRTPSSQGQGKKRKQPSKKAKDKQAPPPPPARRNSAVTAENSPAQTSLPQKRGSVAAKTKLQNNATVLGGQSSGPGAPVFNAGSLRSHGQGYNNSVSPMSPVQMSPFPPQSAGQSPFLPPDMLHMVGMAPQNEMPPTSMDAQMSFGAYSMAPVDGSWPGESQGHTQSHMPHNGSQNPRPDHHQGPIGQQAPMQGHMGAGGLSGFSGSDLPSGWFMPFNMEASGSQDMSQAAAHGNDHGARANADPFGNTFHPNGMTMSNSLDGLQPSM